MLVRRRLFGPIIVVEHCGPPWALGHGGGGVAMWSIKFRVKLQKQMSPII